jgi:hypothetical protein
MWSSPWLRTKEIDPVVWPARPGSKDRFGLSRRRAFERHRMACGHKPEAAPRKDDRLTKHAASPINGVSRLA